MTAVTVPFFFFRTWVSLENCQDSNACRNVEKLFLVTGSIAVLKIEHSLLQTLDQMCRSIFSTHSIELWMLEKIPRFYTNFKRLVQSESFNFQDPQWIQSRGKFFLTFLHVLEFWQIFERKEFPLVTRCKIIVRGKPARDRDQRSLHDLRFFIVIVLNYRQFSHWCS